MDHHELTGALAIHPVAFVQAIDPVGDPLNHVAAHKLWVDTGSGNALKIRNATNDGWVTLFSGAAQVGGGYRLVDFVYDMETAPHFTEPGFNDIDYV